MADLPILFSGPMVLALLREIEHPGTGKTQTRRVLSNSKPNSLFNGQWADSYVLDPGNASWREQELRYAVGDRLWVRESGVQLGNAVDEGRERDGYEVCGFRYAADEATIYLPGMFEGHDYERRRNSIHMPRWASRLTLTVTDVRVQRLQEISEADAIAEGVEPVSSERDEHDWSICPKCGGTGLHGALGASLGVMEVDCVECDTHVKRYHHLWDSLNADRAPWAANPWVVAVTFDPKHGNIDQIAGGA